MKTKKIARAVESDAKLAAKWACDARTVRRWRKARAPFSNPAAMRTWLASRKNIPAGTAALLEATRQTESAAVATQGSARADGAAGAAGALRRLERAEVRSYAAFRKASESGDAVSIKAARETWLKVSESMRRYDLAVEMNRRAVELVPKKLVVDAVRKFAAGLRFAHRGFESCAQLVVGLNDPAAVWSVLAKPADEFMPAALASLEHSGCPAWLLEAFAEGAKAFPADTEHARELAACIPGIVTAYGCQARQLYDARVAAEKRWRECSEPTERSRIWHDELAPLLAGRLPEDPASAPAPQEHENEH